MALDNLKEPPQLVLNRHTNRYINVQPYFNYLHQRCQDRPTEIDERLEELIRFVSLNFDSNTDSLELKNCLSFVFDLRDMFSSMQEFKSN